MIPSIFNFKRLWRVEWLLFAAPLLVIAGGHGFPYTPENPLSAAVSDISVTHFPNALFLKRSLLDFQQIPLWSPTIFSGYPFFANPLAGLWYPPGWLALVIELPFGFNLLTYLHMVFAGFGMLRLLRVNGLSDKAALFGALSFAAMPNLIAHYGAGHLTWVYAVCWTPWLLLAEQHSWITPRPFLRLAPGVGLGVILLTDVRWALYAALLWLAYKFMVSPQSAWQKAKWSMGQLSLALGLSAVVWLPLGEFVSLSTRSQLSPSANLVFSLPPVQLLNLALPIYGQFHEWVLYSGIVAMVLAVVAVFAIRHNKLQFWLGVLVLSLFFSLGDALPWLSTIWRLPLLSLSRVPPRVLPITGMALSFLAAYGCDFLLRNQRERGLLRSLRLVLVGLAGFVSLLATAVVSALGSAPLGYLVSGATLVLAVGAILLKLNRRLLGQFLWAFLIALSFADLLLMNRSLIQFLPKQTVENEGVQLVQFLADQPGVFRVYAPGVHIPQQTAALYGVELANGIDPLYLRAYDDFIQGIQNTPREFYTVIVPFESEAGEADVELTDEAVEQLSVLNVGFVVSEGQQTSAALEQVARFDALAIYQVRSKSPRAYLAHMGEEIPVGLIWSPNKTSTVVQGPGRLVFSEIMYPGWRASMDGNPVPIETSNGLFRSVQVPPGNHLVQLSFLPNSLVAGAILSSLSIGIILVTVFANKEYAEHASPSVPGERL